MVASVERFIELHGLLSRRDKVLVGASGGADSMVLLHLLLRLGYSCDVVHVNYQLRKGESDADAALVSRFCEKWGLRLTALDAGAQMASRPRGGSMQAFARELRYRYLNSVAERDGIRQVVVGHHREDQVETVLLNVLRRTGFDGLAGMRSRRPIGPHSRVALVRPLLESSRADIREYAVENDVPWRADQSNADRRYLRARIRHHVLPGLIAAAGSGVVTDLLDMAHAMRGLVDDVLPDAVPVPLRVASVTDGCVPIAPLLTLDQELRSWLLLRYLRSELPGVPIRRSTVEAIGRLLGGPNGKRVKFKNGSIWKDREILHFVAEGEHRPEAITTMTTLLSVSEGGSATVEFMAGRIFWETLPGLPASCETPLEEILVDADKLPVHVHIRRWKPGDRFRPFGMSGSKKVKSFLNGEKVPPSQRADVHVLCDDEKIVWVIGHRMDERYRISDQTTRVVRFRFEPVRKEKA